MKAGCERVAIVVAVCSLVLCAVSPAHAQFCLGPADCNDQNACTSDNCIGIPAGICVHLGGDCNDFNLCTIDHCDPASGCSHTPKNCDDGNPCTVDSCDLLGQCEHALMEEGTHCTVPGHCGSFPGNCSIQGTCEGVGCLLDTDCALCDDGDPCTAEICDTQRGCVHAPIAHCTAGPSPTPTRTPTRTRTRTPTFTATRTPTRPPTPTQTLTSTRTPTLTRTSTQTRTFTLTPTPSSTRTPTTTPTPTASPTPGCAGDCDASAEVTVNEIVTLVNVALGTGVLANCQAGDTNGDQQITINEIVAAVNNALLGCRPAENAPAVLRQAQQRSSSLNVLLLSALGDASSAAGVDLRNGPGRCLGLTNSRPVEAAVPLRQTRGISALKGRQDISPGQRPGRQSDHDG
jgi:hypothetical protein